MTRTLPPPTPRPAGVVSRRRGRPRRWDRRPSPDAGRANPRHRPRSRHRARRSPPTRHRRVVGARVHLEPVGRPRLTEDPEPPVFAGLPHADHRAAHVDDDGHPAERPSRPWPAPSPDRRARRRAPRSPPHRRLPGRPTTGRARPQTRRACTRDVNPLEQEVHVAAVLLTWIFDRPAEQSTIEVAAAVGIGGQQVDPARGTDGGVVTFRHGGSFVRFPRVRERSPRTTAPTCRSHRPSQPTGSRMTTGITRSVLAS